MFTITDGTEFWVLVHRYNDPDRWGLIHVQPNEPPHVIGLFDAADIDKQIDGLVPGPFMDVQPELKRWITYEIAPLEWQQHLLAGEERYLNRIQVLVRRNMIEPMCQFEHAEPEEAGFLVSMQQLDGTWTYMLACEQHEEEWLRNGVSRPPGYLLVEINSVPPAS